MTADESRPRYVFRFSSFVNTSSESNIVFIQLCEYEKKSIITASAIDICNMYIYMRFFRLPGEARDTLYLGVSFELF